MTVGFLVKVSCIDMIPQLASYSIRVLDDSDLNGLGRRRLHHGAHLGLVLLQHRLKALLVLYQLGSSPGQLLGACLLNKGRVG